MESKKINQLATNLAPVSTDLTIVGDPITGVSKKITLSQIANLFAGSIDFYANLAAFPVTGTINIIYCAKDTQKLYLWSGSAYVETFPSQAVLNTYQLLSAKGVANGYAGLDSAGKVPIAQLPSSIMEYKGLWSAATNTPTLANGTGDTGDVYICSAAGSVNFGAGAITFAVGDYVIYSGSIWQRSSGAVGTVTSVGLSSATSGVTIGSSPVTTSGTITLAIATATTSQNGLLSSTDWATFNGKESVLTFSSPLVRTTNTISIPAATTSVNGYLASADFTTFNNKQNAITLTTTGTSGASTLVGATLNIPNYGSALTGYVPYTGATQDVDLGAFKLNAQSLHAKGTGGLGHLGLKHQSASATASANEVSLFADSLGDLGWLNGNLYLSKFITSGNTAARSYTFPNATCNIPNDSLVVHLAGTETITGAKTFSGGVTFSSSVTTNNLTFANSGFFLTLQPPTLSVNRTVTLPNGTGTLALTSDISYPVTSVFGRTGAVVATSGDYTTAQVTESGNLYFTDSRARLALSFVAGSGAYNSATGVITIPTNNNQITNGAGYTTNVGTVTSVAATGGTGISITGSPITTSGTITITNTAPDQTVALTASTGISVTGTYPNFTITNTSPSSGGTVTSVAALTIGTSGTDLSSTVANSTTTPVITLNVPTASATNRGALSSTDWTTFNNKQNALTNPVTGTGTTNYLPKFTGASTIGNSIVQDDATTVTIGGQLYVNRNDSNVIKVARNGGSNLNTVIEFANASSSVHIGSNGTLFGLGGTTGSVAAQPFIIVPSSSEKLRLDASGNLGLGVTPNSTMTVIRSMQLGYSGIIAGQQGTAEVLYLGSNWYFDGAFRYQNNGFASRLLTAQGAYEWGTAPSGTAGNAITFTQAMTLNASGNLSLGNTNNTYKLDVTGTVNLGGGTTGATSGDLIIDTTSGAPKVIIGRLSSANNDNTLLIGRNRVGAQGWQIDGFGAASFNSSLAVGGAATFSSSVTAKSPSTSAEALNIKYSSSNQMLQLFELASGTDTELNLRNGAGTAINRLSTNGNSFFNGGNVGIGTTVPTAKIQISSTSAGAATVAAFLINESVTTSTEVRLAFAANTNNDIATNRYSYISALNTSGSNGQALIFATNETGNSAVERLRIASTGAATFSGNVNIQKNQPQIQLYQTGADHNYSILGNTSTALEFWHGTYGSNTLKMLSLQAGTGAATFSSSVTATSFFESSSIKGKDIIATNPLLALDIDVIKYTRKNDESKDIRYGYSAEQIHSLMPELTDKDVTAVKYLDVHTILIANLQKEIKELKAKLN